MNMPCSGLICMTEARPSAAVSAISRRCSSSGGVVWASA